MEHAAGKAPEGCRAGVRSARCSATYFNRCLESSGCRDLHTPVRTLASGGPAVSVDATGAEWSPDVNRAEAPAGLPLEFAATAADVNHDLSLYQLLGFRRYRRAPVGRSGYLPPTPRGCPFQA